MLIVALLAAFIFYAGLFLLWESNRVPLDSVAAVLAAVNRMLFLPENVVFVIFRGLLLVVTLYIVGDFLLSTAKRATRRRQEDQKDKLSWKKPPRI